MDFKNLWKEWQAGTGFSRGDVLRLKSGVRGASQSFASRVRDQTVIVVKQSALVPHEYEVVGERCTWDPGMPSERFVRFDINGHDWERVAKA